LAYKIVIADVTELSEEIIDVSFSSKIPEDSFARSSDIEAELVIHGKVSFDAESCLCVMLQRAWQHGHW